MAVSTTSSPSRATSCRMKSAEMGFNRLPPRSPSNYIPGREYPPWRGGLLLFLLLGLRLRGDQLVERRGLVLLEDLFDLVDDLGLAVGQVPFQGLAIRALLLRPRLRFGFLLRRLGV